MDLARLIAARKEQLIALWLAGVQATHPGPPSRSLSRPELVDSLPPFLDELAAALRAGKALEATTLAGEHGEHRLRAGFDIAAVVREYEVLRECILDLAGREDVRVDADETGRLVKSLFVGAERAAAEYVRARDAAAQRKEAEHLGFIAHELRTPLGTAQMALALMEKRLLRPDDGTLGVLGRAIARLRRLVDEALADIRMRSVGRLRLQRVSLREFTTELQQDLALEVGARGQRVDVRSDDAVLTGDPLVLRSAVMNLLVNAMKFSPEGATISLRATAGAEEVRIAVQDQCGGLPPVQLEELFSPFVQAGANRSGLGLGLAIARQAAEAHGGSLQAHDVPGTGCVFELSLPLAPPVRTPDEIA